METNRISFTKAMCLDTIKSLSRSNGFYGRILLCIDHDKDWGEKFLQDLADQHFHSVVDLVLYLEC